MGFISNPPQYDAIIVGSGFGGLYTLHQMRKQNLKCLVIDEGSDIGGVWHWNCYPGARVDTKIPLYEFSDENLWRDWVWTEKYPGADEIRRYFEHVESKLHLKRDILFYTRVIAASFDNNPSQWTVTTNDEQKRTARYFVLATGFAAKALIPSFKNLETFAGPCFHTSRWPQERINCSGKRVGIVGNGSSGLQVIQELGPVVEHMTVFQRSPTYALPMRQRPLSVEEQDKCRYEAIYELRKHTFAGLDTEFSFLPATSVPSEQRQAFFEEIWEEGGLSFWLGTYRDVIMNKDINREAYEFWRKKVLPRIKDPKNAELLAPEEPPYYFGTKRATLEQCYYEVYNQDNVKLVDAKNIPIVDVRPNGVLTADGQFHELDVLILATGFDSVTGGILNIDIRGRDGASLREKWKNGTWTHLGLMTSGFPNMFFLYGPQGPTSFCNGPTCAEVQGNWIVQTIKYLRSHGNNELEPTAQAEEKWRGLVNQIGDATLLPATKSEYMGTNVPGKPKEMLNYLGGLTEYIKNISSTITSGYSDFSIN
ncbi:monooxygenase [Penicillium cosmopolitanum]|uniref:Monooxygenase n=1 Tax=Penicillium cosmopolitanum TaxID=1131564 RepID=A0A9W9SLD7_9EURO|nr:monooxygenase [Penicillium cosmopolitanum]KAJ5379384.1 monooxygenase [Penicillium cosmopolitanum]